MFCIQEPDDPLSDPFASVNCDPFAENNSELSSEPLDFETPSLNIKVYKIKAFETYSNGFEIQKFKENRKEEELVPKFKKNGEVAKKRGPKKGFKRKRSEMGNITLDLVKEISENSDNSEKSAKHQMKKTVEDLKVEYLSRCPPSERGMIKKLLESEDSVLISPHGTEFWQIKVDPNDYFPNEPYRMIFYKKRNPKWKEFPYQCEFCGKGYRLANTLLVHTSEEHGACSRVVAKACPCCPHVAVQKKYRAHLFKHATTTGKLFCQYCIPILSPDDEKQGLSVLERYPYKKFPKMWYTSEDSLKSHRKRKHPYAAFLFCGWEGEWMDYRP